MKSFNVLSIALLTAVMVATLAFSENPPAAPIKLPIPDVPALKEAQNLVNEVYADDIAKAKSPQAKAELSKKLLKAAVETKNDAAGKYVLLTLARDYAADAGDIAGAFQAIEELEGYQTDALAMRVGVLATIAKTVRGQDAHGVIERANTVIDEALAADRYDLAKQSADVTVAVAKTTKDLDIIKQANVRVQEVRTGETAFNGAAKALGKLADNPDDGDANLVAGRFYCFVKGQWEKGLPLLVLGSDAALKQLAEKDLAKPTEADKQVELGDGWWTLADRQTGADKGRIRERAACWYEKALPSLTGLVKAKVEKRVGELLLVYDFSNIVVEVVQTLPMELDRTKFRQRATATSSSYHPTNYIDGAHYKPENAVDDSPLTAFALHGSIGWLKVEFEKNVSCSMVVFCARASPGDTMSEGTVVINEKHRLPFRMFGGGKLLVVKGNGVIRTILIESIKGTWHPGITDTYFIPPADKKGN